jgi:hypothetical protein
VATKLNFFLCVAVAFAQTKPPAAGVGDFESTAFCKKYHCVLTGVPEPIASSGAVKEFLYNYRVSNTPPQLGLRLTTSGKRARPFLTVRWLNPYSLTERDLAGIPALVRELTGKEDFDAAKFVADFSTSKPQPHEGAGPSVRVGRFDIYCTRTSTKQPQITLTIEEMSIGTATMTADGTIVLSLRAEGPGRMIGDGQLRYPKNHPDYQKILAHLGGLEPGESKPVAPWPDGQ